MLDLPSHHSPEIIETLGPFFSNAGLKNWDLCLSEDIIVAFPRSFWLTVKTGVFAGLGMKAAMANVWSKSAETDGRRILLDIGDPKWRRYPISELQGIACIRSAGANEIRLQRHNAKQDIYGLGDRSQTDMCRKVLRQLYGSLYSEKGFT